MPFERIVAVNVKDPEMYAQYRAGMTPLLEKAGGEFRYDWEAKTLKSATPAPMNRVFVIRFPDEATHDAFFANMAYKRVRAQFLEKGVSDITVIATYEVSSRRLHIALSAGDIEKSVADYTRRLGSPPTVVVPGEYAVWRTATLNLSIRRDGERAGTLRHLGWEDGAAPEFSKETDVNGIVWERFTPEQQAAEIDELWPKD